LSPSALRASAISQIASRASLIGGRDVYRPKNDPDCPGVGCAPDDASLTNWDIGHSDRGKFGYSHIDQKRWAEIFGPRGKPWLTFTHNADSR
jgi:hypothetical protein